LEPLRKLRAERGTGERHPLQCEPGHQVILRVSSCVVTIATNGSGSYGMEGLYALHKEWKAPRSPATARFGLPARRPKDAEFLAAFENTTVLIGLDVLARYDHLLNTERQRLQAPGAAECST
jgi:hypothetical protein